MCQAEICHLPQAPGKISHQQSAGSHSALAGRSLMPTARELPGRQSPNPVSSPCCTSPSGWSVYRPLTACKFGTREYPHQMGSQPTGRPWRLASRQASQILKLQQVLERVSCLRSSANIGSVGADCSSLTQCQMLPAGVDRPARLAGRLRRGSPWPVDKGPAGQYISELLKRWLQLGGKLILQTPRRSWPGT